MPYGEPFGLMQKAESGGGGVQYVFWCPGCQSVHIYFTAWPADQAGRPIWQFNGNPDAPTFSPSLLNTRPGHRCHLFVTDGNIIYCSDCDHSLAGQTVPMEKLD